MIARRLLAASVAFASISGFAFAQREPKRKPSIESKQISLFSISGKRVGNGATLISVGIGAVLPPGVKVYSEPSHTLLLGVVTSDFLTTAAGRKLQSEIEAASAGVLIRQSNSESGEARVSAPARPEEDDSISILEIAGEQEKLLVEAKLGGADFEFSGSLVSSEGDKSVMVPLWCCQAGGCDPPPNCCEGSHITCCGPPGCEFYCSVQKCPGEGPAKAPVKQ
jgi:hypothetical protein